MTGPVWWQLLLVAASAHVGLQVVVHLVVYPALADASTTSPGTADLAHRRHGRRMSVAVAPVYGLLAVASVGVAVAEPSWSAAVALGVVLATFLVTGTLAVPTHEAIAAEGEPSRRALLHRRLARVDLARVALAVCLLAVVWTARA